MDFRGLLYGSSFLLLSHHHFILIAIFLFLFLVTLVVIIAASLVGGLVGMIGGAGSVGKMLGGLVEAGFGLVATMISIAISAAAYRQLATTQAGDIFA